MTAPFLKGYYPRVTNQQLVNARIAARNNTKHGKRTPEGDFIALLVDDLIDLKLHNTKLQWQLDTEVPL